MKEETETKNLSFPKTRPVCCGKEMYPSGGVLGVKPNGEHGDIIHFWTCGICKSEIEDHLSN